MPGLPVPYQNQLAPSSSALSSSSAWERLRFLSSELRMTLHLLVSENTPRPGVASPELIQILMTHLGEVAHLRRTGQLGDGGAKSEPDWRDYRTTLEDLNHILPKLEQQLRDDRTRLGLEQDRLSQASAWTTTTKLTR